MSQTILIIDDFASVRLYHSSFLARKGYHCLGAGSGAEALDLIRQQPVDLIVLDLLMPRMDGAAFVAHLDALPHLASLPVLVVTSEPQRAIEAFRLSSRPLSVLAKPVLPTELLQRVQRLLPTPAAVPVAIAS